METMEIDTVLRPGDKVRVLWGNLGQVEAMISRINNKGDLFVRRWRPKMRNYTQPRKVYVVTSDENGNVYDLKPPPGSEELLM